MGFYDYNVTDAKGNQVSLKEYENKVVLVVNTATGCGFTPQYEEIEKMYETYHNQGFEVLDIPCNQFGQQTPGSDEEIHEFCSLHYNTQFPQMHKSDVNGENELPLFTFLKKEKGFAGFTGEKAEFMNAHVGGLHPDFKETSDIKWNFTKFLIDRQGNVVERYEPTAEMSDIKTAVKNLL
ncbi:MAG: glutathione peroxidase [Erysipelotrichaceae bacterium]|nr:glutathione peroxidase [Erysipelotrichaceae bacterium]MDY6034777.1 glutathione peroxidase [Bulleidia sp.]